MPVGDHYTPSKSTKYTNRMSSEVSASFDPSRNLALSSSRPDAPAVSIRSRTAVRHLNSERTNRTETILPCKARQPLGLWLREQRQVCRQPGSYRSALPTSASFPLHLQPRLYKPADGSNNERPLRLEPRRGESDYRTVLFTSALDPSMMK